MILHTRQIRNFIFLREVLLLALTCIGGPQVHLTSFINIFVHKRRYLTEAELMELQALCMILPGPSSTQTLTAIGYRIGGTTLAWLTVFVWILPSTLTMIAVAYGINYIDAHLVEKMIRFVKPMGIAFIFFASYSIGRKVINTKTSIVLLVLSAAMAYLFRSPYITPLWILLGGLATTYKMNQQEKREHGKLKVQWKNFYLWAGVLVLAAVIGFQTKSLPVRLFENFYRNGSLAIGGGHILKPLLYNEFVEFKHYLTKDEFLTGLVISELMPGPTFSVASFVGALSLRSWGFDGYIVGAVIASAGIFLPGTFLIFFVYKFWEQLKQYRVIRASLEGINAASTGLTISAGISLLGPMSSNPLSISIIAITFLLLLSEKIKPYMVISLGLLLGYFMP